jgi:hypothetical protein
MEDSNYTSYLKQFTSVMKSVTSKNDVDFKKIFKEIDHAPEIVILKRCLEYLRWKQC